jgi:ferredoxin-fold anticodon binding domain-containing protein
MSPRKVKKFKTVRPIMEVEIPTESSKLLKNRIYRFKELLGPDAEEWQVDHLAHSEIDYWDLDKLLKNGCDPELAIEILR